MKPRFICAFPGRRDGYQVPAALAEEGWLERFLTDFYWSGLTAWAGEKILSDRRLESARNRQHPAIPPERVRVLWGNALWRCIDRVRKRPLAVRYATEGVRFAEAVREEARRHRADLLLYPPCSHEAFTAAYPRHHPRRILFQFHPHPAFQERILRADLAEHPEMEQTFQVEIGSDLPEKLQRRDLDTWRSADLLLCASSFTKSSLVAVGADPARCHVIPYGVDHFAPMPDDGGSSEASLRPVGFQALFIGTGMQRKGLHHLLAAWNNAALPAASSLTIVARRVDPGLLPALTTSRNTRLLSGGVSTDELRRLYQTSTLFVMPSLVEGFGAVFLEAMHGGCPVLGTRNTCLPDIGDEADGVFLTPPGDVDALTARIEQLSSSLPDQPGLRQAARGRAAEFTWARFRRELIQTIAP